MTDQEMLAKMDQIMDAVTKGSSAPRRGNAVTPGVVFGGGGSPYRQHDARDWPVEELKKLQPYDMSAVQLMCKGKRPRLSGCGPALVKLAALASGQNEAVGIARSQGLLKEGYGMDSFEKEHGFYPCTREIITKGYDGREVRKAALAENSGQTGGYTVPPQFMTELLTIAAEEAFVEPRARVLPMTSRTADWPTLDITTAQATGTSPYYGGVLASWQPEAATINETEPAFRQTTFTAWDLVLYSVASNQLLQDNGIGLDALLTQLFGGAITWYKEYAFLRGTGSGATMPMGLLNAGATYVQNRAVTSRFILQDAAAMMSHLQVRSWDDACWVMHQSVLPQLIQMASGAVANTASTTYIPGNTLVWMTPFGDGTQGPAGMKLPKAFLGGLPIFFTEKLPSLGTKGDVMLIDFGQYIIGQRLEMQLDVSRDYLFRNNQLAYRVVARCDGRPWLNTTITDANGWSVSPYVCLN